MSDEEIAEFVGEDAFVADEPELFEENVEYFEAFFDLTTSRQEGLDRGFIPVSEIASYWDRVPLDDFLTFLRRIRAADAAFIEWHRERRREREANGQ
jgi:hypothetical protein